MMDKNDWQQLVAELSGTAVDMTQRGLIRGLLAGDRAYVQQQVDASYRERAERCRAKLEKRKEKQGK